MFIIGIIVGTSVNIEFSRSAFAQYYSAEEEESVYVYAEPLPSWAGYASNVIYEATNAWTEANPNLKFYVAPSSQEADLYVQWIRDYGTGYAGEHITGTGVIQVGLGDSNCLGKWEPYSSNTVIRISEHEIGHFLGLGHSSDPNSIMYHTATIEYGIVELQESFAPNYGWFVPICTANDVTSYAYQVNTSEPNYGFDLYFVPSSAEYDKYLDNQSFTYYSDDGCYAKNYLSFGDTCRGVSNGSGLLIIVHELTDSLARITVKLQEQASFSGSSLPAISKENSPPQTQMPFVYGEIIFDRDSYSSNEYAIISILDPDENRNTQATESVKVRLSSTTDPTGVSVEFLETGPNTGIFEEVITFTSVGISSGTTLRVSPNDTITAKYVDRTIQSGGTVELLARAFVGGMQIQENNPPIQPSVSSQPFLNVGQPELVDQRGVKLTNARIGSSVLIQSEMTNMQQTNQPFVYIVLIKDNYGVTQSLSWLTGSLPRIESMKASQSWTPVVKGYYTMEVFVWQSINNPVALSPQRIVQLLVTA